MRSIVAAMAVLTAVGACAAGAGASRARRPNSFEGSCRLSGALRFHSPIGNVPRTVSFGDRASGTCSGTLDGRRVDAVRVVNRVSGSGTLSCAAGSAHTVDTLTFAHRYRIRILTDSAFAGVEAIAHSRGAVSGDSVEHVTFHVDQATLDACAAGTLRTARYDLDAEMPTPLVG